MANDLDELIALAEAATPGPWDTDGMYINGQRYEGGGGGANGTFPVAMIRGWGHLQYLGEERATQIQIANADYLCALSPDRMLPLLRAVKEARDALVQRTKRSSYHWSSGGQYTAFDWKNEGSIECATAALSALDAAIGAK